MSKNAELMSTAPSCFARDTCPPSVSGKSSGQTEHSLRQVTAPSFLHVTPKYYYLRLVVPLIVWHLVWAQHVDLIWCEKCTAVTQVYSTAVP